MTTDPTRLVHDAEALNSAVWPIRTDELVTPVDRFFTRSHAPTPHIDVQGWSLEVRGLVRRPGRFTFEELERAYPKREVTATMVCAGLRRDEFLTLGPLPGELPWGPEPISTGRWGGIALADLLREVDVKDQARYVEFVGLDTVERLGQRFGFGGSIDMSKALSDEVLLATQLNGAPLTPDHGFPLRMVVPGWAGARSVKWLGQIVLTTEPSPNYFQRKAYRVQREINPQDVRDVTRGEAITEVPLNAVILDPTSESTVAAGQVMMRGWAMGEGGRRVTSVEVSTDDGRAWLPARIVAEGPAWTWSFWEVSVPLAPGDQTLVARATDSAGNTQPPTLAATWNVRGYNNNAWHRVQVHVE